jgi:hypothetical protein
LSYETLFQTSQDPQAPTRPVSRRNLVAPDFDAPMELVESSKLAALEALKSGDPKKKAKMCRSGKKSRA